jgi:hypothetical protein
VRLKEMKIMKKEVRIECIQKHFKAYRSGLPAQGRGKRKGPTPQASQPHTTINLGSSVLAVK